MTFKILENNIPDDNYNKKIIKLNWIHQENIDAVLFDRHSGNSFLYYIKKMSELDWSKYSTKKAVEKSYGLYGTDELEMAKKEYQFSYDADRLNRVLNLQATPWHYILRTLINSSDSLGLLDIYKSITKSMDLKKLIIKELLLFRHYYQDNIIVHGSERLSDNKDWVFLFFIKVNDNHQDKIVFIDSQENIFLENNQVIMFPAHLANDFMIVKKNQEEEPLYYIQANLSAE